MKKILCLFAVLSFMLCMGCTKDVNNKEPVKKPSVNEVVKAPEKAEEADVTLYFSDKQGFSLQTESRKVTKDTDFVKNIVQLLIDGPENKELLSLIPKSTEVNDVSVSDGICYLDLSGEFVNGAYGTSVSDTLCVYSIVNTLTGLDEIDKVRFYIDGKSVEIFGELIFNEPFEADGTFIKK